MSEFLEILKYILPSLVVLALAYLLIKAFLENEIKKQVLEIKRASSRVITPIQLQAYERLILFLERIQPSGLIMRVSKANQSKDQLRNAMISNIRDEFEHNLSQQVYISSKAWELVKNAKENVISTVNAAASKSKDDAPGTEFAGLVIEIWSSQKQDPVNRAIEFLKEEIREKF